MEQPTWIGRTLSGRYKIEALLGQGGMSAVYKAFDPNLKRVVAIKLIHAHLSIDSTFTLRFENEASAVASLRHPNIVQVYDFNNDSGVYYMILEFIPGETLYDRLKRLSGEGRMLSVEEALKFAINIAEAMAYAHQRGMVHRDIKPANIMLDMHNQAILMDFGIVKIHGGDSHTSTGAVVGTARYMSPEIIRGEVADPRSDIYSLGVTLYEALGNRPPFVADSAMTVMMMHLNDPVPDVRGFRGDIHPKLVTILERCLAKDRTDRYQSAAEMAADLRYALVDIEEQPTVIHVPVVSKPQSSTPGLILQPAPVDKSSSHDSLGRLPITKRFVPALKLRLLGLIFGVFAMIVCLGSVGKIVINNLPLIGSSPTASATPQPTTTNTPLPSKTPIPPTSSFGIGSTIISNKDSMTLLYVPAGEFIMGSDNDKSGESPAHVVDLDSFWIDKTEVTVYMYSLCVEAGTCREPINKSSSTHSNYYGNPEFDDYPVVYVDWNMAKTYCAWADRRLPTEAEWEKSARGENGFAFPWGNQFDGARTNFCDKNCPFDYANRSYDDGFADNSPTGRYTNGASPYHVLDMAGNVWEWVSSLYKPYPYNAADGRDDLSISGERVLRGGSRNNADSDVRSTFRHKLAPSDAFVVVGFRCAMDAAP